MELNRVLYTWAATEKFNKLMSTLIDVTQAANDEGIEVILGGSAGVELLTKESLGCDDLDVSVHIEDLLKFSLLLIRIGFTRTGNLNKNQYVRNGVEVDFGAIEDYMERSGVSVPDYITYWVSGQTSTGSDETNIGAVKSFGRQTLVSIYSYLSQHPDRKAEKKLKDIRKIELLANV